MLSETWLQDGIKSSELAMNNYAIYRLDRNGNTTSFTRGGGVLIAVKHSLTSQLIKINDNSIEQLFVDIKLNGLHIMIGTVYIPPSSGVEAYASSIKKSVLLCGDYTRLALSALYNI